jgi:predicted transcriptional regulator
MSTTTIRLPEALKLRVAAAAKRSGKTAHGFILEAIAEKTADAETRSAFEAQAGERYAQIVASGRTIPWSEMRAYLTARAAGGRPRRPVARKPTR